MAKRKPAGKFVVLTVLQGHVHIILDEELENPMVWPTFDDAMAFTTSGHAGVTAAETVLIVDCETGQTEML